LPTADRHPHHCRCARIARLSRNLVVEYASSSRCKSLPVAVGVLRQPGAGRTSTTCSVSIEQFCGEPGLVPKHHFLVFCCTFATCCSTPVRPNAETTGQRPPIAALRSLVFSCSLVLCNYLMVDAPDLRDVPPLPLHIWPQVTHPDASPNMPVLLLSELRWTGPCSVKTNDYARARVFVIAQLIYIIPLLNILPRRAPRASGQPEYRTPHPAAGRLRTSQDGLKPPFCFEGP